VTTKEKMSGVSALLYLLRQQKIIPMVAGGVQPLRRNLLPRTPPPTPRHSACPSPAISDKSWHIISRCASPVPVMIVWDSATEMKGIFGPDKLVDDTPAHIDPSTNISASFCIDMPNSS